MGAKYSVKIDRRYQIIAFILIWLVLCFPGLIRVAQGNGLERLSAELRYELLALEQEIAEENYGFTVGYNPALEYSIEELCGLVEPEDAEQTALFQTLMGDTPVPYSFDWRSKGGVTPVKDQRGCGACWAFATVAALESAIKIQTGITKDLSEQYLLSCNVEEPKWNCTQGGWWAHDYHLSKIPPGEPEAGTVYGVDFPYTARDDFCNPPHDHYYVINSWGYIGTKFSTPSVAKIKQAIYTYGPVCAAVYVDSAFQSYTGGVFDRHANGDVNHAILLVGWNDNYINQGKTYGVWILKNSWGPYWGDNGYMYITYNTSSVGYSANYINFSNTNKLPVAKISATPLSGRAPLLVTFTGAGSSDPDGYIVSYRWDFGDGSTASGVSRNHKYTSPGTYVAKLEVEDDDGNTGKKSITIEVENPDIPDINKPPVAVISATPLSGPAPLLVTFNGAGSYDPDGSIVSYKWDFGDGSTGSGVLIDHEYLYQDSYVAKLEVKDNEGKIGRKSITIKVGDGGPICGPLEY